MSKQGFTPGPWYAALGPQGGYVISDVANHFGLCQRASWPSRVAESEANARLIASAPDLYAALGKCVTALMFEAEQAQQRQDAVAGAQILDALTAARAALEKVRA